MPNPTERAGGAAHTCGISTLSRTRLPDDFALESGDTDQIERWTDFSVTGPPNGPVAVVLGGISANRHVCDSGPDQPGWWRNIVGSARPIDTDRVRVVGLDWLGSRLPSLRGHAVSAGSPEQPPEPARYPLISTGDQARALKRVLDTVGSGPVDVLIGASYGGMVGLAFAAMYPSSIRRLVLIGAAHRTHPMATAHRVLQRRFVDLARVGGEAGEGLMLARALAMTTYRTAEEFDDRFSVRPAAGSRGRFEVEEYLEARGRRFRDEFSSRTFECLSHSIDLHFVDPSAVHVPTELVSIDSDTLVPPWLMDELESRISGPCRRHRLCSAAGHDAFLTETDSVGALLSSFIDERRNDS